MPGVRFDACLRHRPLPQAGPRHKLAVMSATPTNEVNTLPVITRKRESRLGIPSGRKELTPEEFQAEQDKKQALHRQSFLENKEREKREQKAARERKRYLGLKTSSERIDGVEEISASEAVNMAAELEQRQIIPPRGPKTDDRGTVIDEGEVPIVRGRTKKLTKVEAARVAEEKAKKAKTRKVIM